MLGDTIFVEESDLPPLTDAKMIKLAQQMRDEVKSYEESTQELRRVIWPACDRMYMCFRDLPRGPNMPWVDNGVLGESDGREAVKAVIDQILLSQMPPDESWLACARPDTDQAILDRISDWQADIHHKAQTRDAYSAHLTQCAIRGTSFIGVRWEKRYAVRNLAPRPVLQAMQSLADAAGATDENGARLKVNNMMKYYLAYNGPVIHPIDNYRIFLDPTAELGLDCDVPSAMLVYKTMTDLKSAKDEQTGQRLYDDKALEGVQEMTAQEIFSEDPWQFQSTRNMGITLDAAFSTGKVVPIYIFHRMTRTTDDGDQWVDKFFYVARSKDNNGWRIIRVQDNPSGYGDKPFYMDTYDRWLNCVYGTGMLEKSLSAWKAKNILAALTLNSKVATVFPAMHYISGIIKDDRKPILNPGGLQQITYRMGIGLDFMKPAPLNPEGGMLGIQEQQFLGAKILSQAGAMGAALYTDPNKSLSAEKTATQVRQESSNAVVGRENIVEKFTISSLQPMCQAVYNASRTNFTEDASYVKRTANGEVSTGKVTREEINGEGTSVEIVGRRGIANKAHEIANLTDTLKILTTGNIAQVLPNYPLILQDVLIKLIARLGVPMKPEYKLTPMQLAMMDPKAQLEMLLEALKTPEGRQMAAEVLLSSPEGQQFVAQIHQEGAASVGQQSEQLSPHRPA